MCKLVLCNRQFCLHHVIVALHRYIYHYNDNSTDLHIEHFTGPCLRKSVLNNLLVRNRFCRQVHYFWLSIFCVESEQEIFTQPVTSKATLNSYLMYSEEVGSYLLYPIYHYKKTDNQVIFTKNSCEEK